MRTLLFGALLVSLLLVACGGSADPQKPVEDYFKALEEMDVDKASAAVCVEYQDANRADLEALESSGVKIEVVDLNLGVEEKEGDETTLIVVNGKLNLSAGGKKQEYDLAQEYGTIEVVRRGGQWRICDKLFLLGDPQKPVRDFFAALEALDLEQFNSHLCQEQQIDIDDLGLAELEEMGIDPEELLGAFEIKTRDVKYEEKSRDDNLAIVAVSGKISLDFDTDKLKDVFKRMVEAAGEPVSDEELDMAVGIFAMLGGEQVEFEQDIKVIKKDGNWVVCDELNILDGLMDF